VRFCALEYRARELGGATFTILLVFEDANGGLYFFVHPNWRSLVQPRDLKIVSDLLVDFLERADKQPADLLTQLSSLGVGPLVTRESGERFSDYPQLLESLSQFIQL